MIREAHALGNAERVQRTTQAVNGMPERRLLELCRDTYVEATKKKREGGREGAVAVCIIVGANGKPICTNAVYRVVMSIHVPDVHVCPSAYTWPSMYALCKLYNTPMITGSISQNLLLWDIIKFNHTIIKMNDILYLPDDSTMHVIVPFPQQPGCTKRSMQHANARTTLAKTSFVSY